MKLETQKDKNESDGYEKRDRWIQREGTLLSMTGRPLYCRFQIDRNDRAAQGYPYLP